MHWRVTGGLPPSCACGAANASRHARLKFQPPSRRLSAEALPSATLKLIDAISWGDAALYAAALARTIADARECEAATGVRILCAEDLAKLARDAAHLPVVMHLIGDLVRSYE